MITVLFHGDLRQFGRRFDLQVSSPAQALRALTSQIEGLEKHLSNGFYQVRFGGRDWTQSEVENRFGEDGGGVLHLVPRTVGAGKNGGMQLVLGVALIAASWVAGGMAGWGYLGAAGAMNTFATGLFMMGMSMIMGGVAQMLSKQPKMGGLSSGSENRNSTSFSNLANTQAQGVPVPLAYGTIMCGTRVISQSVESYRISQDGGVDEMQQRKTAFRSRHGNKAKFVIQSSAEADSFVDVMVFCTFHLLNTAFTAAAPLPGYDERQFGMADWPQEPGNETDAGSRGTVARLVAKMVAAIGNPAIRADETLDNQTNLLLSGYDALIAQKLIMPTGSPSDFRESVKQLLHRLAVSKEARAGADVFTQIRRTYHTPVAAIAPDGRPYDIDLNHESVRAVNYTARIEKA